MNELISYKSINGLEFGDSPSKAKELFGPPNFEQQTRSGKLQMHYDEFILIFSSGDRQLRECCVPFDVPTRLNGELIDWSLEGLFNLCRAEKEPLVAFSTIILFTKGLALTGLEEHAESDRSIGIFDRNIWSPHKDQMTPFNFHTL